MEGRRLLIGALCLLGLIAGCGNDDTGSSTKNRVDTGSCAYLADSFVDITRDIIDKIGDRTNAEMESPPADLEAAAEDWVAARAELTPQVADLCADGEFDELLCERKASIEPAGEAGQRFLQENYPDCSQVLPGQTTLPQDG